jgi:hypothetical protein
MIDTPVQVTTKFWDVERGRELDSVFYFETDVKDEDILEGTFFPVDQLPDLTIDHHKVMIPEIAVAFLHNKEVAKLHLTSQSSTVAEF